VKRLAFALVVVGCGGGEARIDAAPPPDAGPAIDAEPGHPVAWTVIEDLGPVAYGWDVDVGGDGSVVVIATVTSLAVSEWRDAWIARYDADGSRLWTDRVPNDLVREGIGRGVAVLADGSIVAVGTAGNDLGQAADGRLWIRQYLPDGTIVRTIEGEAGGAVAVERDPAGGFVTVSQVYDGSPADHDVRVEAWEADGSPRWAEVIPDGATDLVAQDVLVGDDGGVIVIATAWTGSASLYARRYDASGAADWTVYPSGLDVVVGAELDLEGNAILAYLLEDGGPTHRASLRAIARVDGSNLWGSPMLTQRPSDPFDVAVDAEGTIAICGSSYSTRMDWDLWIERRTATRALDWVDTLDGRAHDADVCEAIAFDPTGALIAVGSVVNEMSDADLIVRKYIP
jgi:hypothetical protein